ncbi:MAG: ligase-associated DNA damage response endonuclease PdeM [Terrimonas sp.]|nr:ligase-associated DNA damage response endonuclease PdeM [Terrimonas sp.]
MTQPLLYKINNQHFWISPERCIFWEEKKTLLLADLHAGKTGHFRKSGIAVPQKIYKEDLQRLLTQVLFFKADRLMILGDLSHSKSNKELDLFIRWRKDFHLLEVVLVKGNHDILDEAWYREGDITVIENRLVEEKFCFQHDGETVVISEDILYAFTGHIHPGIHIRGVGKQSLRFPCFYFTDDICVLPAFSQFTGLSPVRPKPGHQVFAIVEKEIIRVH